MAVEHALLRVRDGQSEAFVAAMHEARDLIAASPGLLFLEVRPASEHDDLFLLLVHWENIASHRDGFRRSKRYQSWRDLLHGFYALTPDVTYFGASIFDD